MNDNDQPTEASPKTDAAQAYAERIEAKRERYAALAVKKDGEAQAAYAANCEGCTGVGMAARLTSPRPRRGR